MRNSDPTSKTSPLEQHPSQEVLEKYLLNGLEDNESATVEQHLLGCSDCVEVAKGLDDYVRAMRQALAQKVQKARAAKKGH